MELKVNPQFLAESKDRCGTIHGNGNTWDRKYV